MSMPELSKLESTLPPAHPATPAVAMAAAESAGKEPLAPFVIAAMEVLQASHTTGDLAVQVRSSGYGGFAHLRSGETLSFDAELPDATMHELDCALWGTKGFTDNEARSGVSILMGYRGTEDNGTRHVFVSGLFDPSEGIRVLRLVGDAWEDSSLVPEEKATMVRVAFLSALVGYVSDRYAEQSPPEAVDTFLDELQASGGAFDSDVLRSMFIGWTTTEATGAHNLMPTVVAGTTRFYALVDNYRNDVLYNARHGGDVSARSRALVQSGEYFSRILTSLGYDMGNRGVSPLALV